MNQHVSQCDRVVLKLDLSRLSKRDYARRDRFGGQDGGDEGGARRVNQLRHRDGTAVARAGGATGQTGERLTIREENNLSRVRSIGRLPLDAFKLQEEAVPGESGDGYADHEQDRDPDQSQAKYFHDVPHSVVANGRSDLGKLRGDVRSLESYSGCFSWCSGLMRSVVGDSGE